METTIKINNKYTIIHGDGKGLRALRHGEEWRDLTGDGLILAMAQKIEGLLAGRAIIRTWLEEVNASDGWAAQQDGEGEYQAGLRVGKLRGQADAFERMVLLLEKGTLS